MALNKLFHHKSKSSHKLTGNLARLTLDSLPGLPSRQAHEDLARYLHSMKVVLHGEADVEPNEAESQQLTIDICSMDLIFHLIQNLQQLEFEARKDAAQVITCVLRCQVSGRSPGVEYLLRHTELLDKLVVGYENSEIALNCGLILRETSRYEPLAKYLLYSPLFFNFFKYIEVDTFDVASDAFITFKDLLTRHKAMVAGFLMDNYSSVLEMHYTQLLKSQNYVTRRQSLKLLGEMLLDRVNVNVMLRYISEAANLRLMMTLLTDPSKNIQYEAFHVFKVFVANPNKPAQITEILANNAQKLLRYLADFHTDKDDEQFTEEKELLAKEIASLQPPTGRVSPVQSTSSS
eukprot:jgi/Chlat1/1668/Chrsp127S01910